MKVSSLGIWLVLGAVLATACSSGGDSKAPPTSVVIATAASSWRQRSAPARGAATAAVDFSGSGVKVAVIDSGFDRNHPDLAFKIAGGHRWVSTGTTCWHDDNGHGTHVAGSMLRDFRRDYVAVQVTCAP